MTPAQHDSVTATEDAAITFNPITGNNEVSGADNFENAGRALTAVGTPAHGTVTFSANGDIVYTPAANYNGPDSFTYTVTSGGVTETATIDVNVAAVNDMPVNTVPAAQTTAVAIRSWSLSHPRSANGMVFPNAMLIELSRLVSSDHRSLSALSFYPGRKVCVEPAAGDGEIARTRIH